MITFEQTLILLLLLIVLGVLIFGFMIGHRACSLWLDPKHDHVDP